MSRRGGRPALKLYQYSDKESGFRYLRSYETQMEVFDKYFDSKGKLFQGNKEYRELPDGTFICKFRIGREGLRTRIRIDNDIYCKEYKDDFPISVFNLLGKKVAEFSSIRVCSEMTGIPYSEIQARTKYNYHPTAAQLKFVKS